MGASKSYVEFLLDRMGGFGVLILLSALALFVGACIVVFVSKRPAAIAAYLVFIPIPVLLSVYAAIQGSVTSFEVIALSETELKQSEIAGGLAEILLLIQIAILASVPSYLVTGIGLFVRALQASRQSAADIERAKILG